MSSIVWYGNMQTTFPEAICRRVNKTTSLSTVPPPPLLPRFLCILAHKSTVELSLKNTRCRMSSEEWCGTTQAQLHGAKNKPNTNTRKEVSLILCWRTNFANNDEAQRGRTKRGRSGSVEISDTKNKDARGIVLFVPHILIAMTLNQRQHKTANNFKCK